MIVFDLCLLINQVIIKYVDFVMVLCVIVEVGVQVIGFWWEFVNEVGFDEVVWMFVDLGLCFMMYCCGGFFIFLVGFECEVVFDDNCCVIEEIVIFVVVGVEGFIVVFVFVVGGLFLGLWDLIGVCECVCDVVGVFVLEVEVVGVIFVIELLYLMYVFDCVVVLILGQVFDIVVDFDFEVVGVVVDIFYIWWDLQVFDQIV